MRGIRFIRELLRDTRGSSAVEYGFILALVVIAVMGAIAGLADETQKMWTNVATKAAKAHSGGN